MKPLRTAARLFTGQLFREQIVGFDSYHLNFPNNRGTDMTHLSNRDYLSDPTQNLPKVIT